MFRINRLCAFVQISTNAQRILTYATVMRHAATDLVPTHASATRVTTATAKHVRVRLTSRRIDLSNYDVIVYAVQFLRRLPCSALKLVCGAHDNNVEQEVMLLDILSALSVVGYCA